MKSILTFAFFALFSVQIATAEAPLEINPEPAPKVLTIEEQILKEIKSYSWDHDIAVKLFTHESGLNPKAVNSEAHKNWKTGEVICHGSFNIPQIACVNWKKGEDRQDYKRALAIAYELYTRAGGKFGRDWPPCKRIKGCL